jgi:2-polyprenyl-3-methyl-5-hydroxy-6-metoxy-1,4-benzoquinol methylase
VLAKLRRIIAMSPSKRRARLRTKWGRWGPQGLLLQASWLLDRMAKRSVNRPYVGRADVGPRNLAVKQARLAAGGAFEQPAIQLVSLAAVGFIPEGSRVLEVGGGTGFFATSAARLRQATVSCSELDAPTRNWAESNRPHARVTYCDLTLDAARGRGFEAVVALELIEHLNAFGPFLKSMAEVAPVAILSTPNKLRDPFSAVRTVPDYDEHVLEWTAGEFYWVLKSFWTDVEIWTIRRYAEQTRLFEAGLLELPVVAPAGMWEFEAPLIAVCKTPVSWGAGAGHG